MHGKQNGFTLIELLIVCTIIGVLAALAIPNYFFARQNAINAVAVSDMRGLLPAVDVASTTAAAPLPTIIILPTGGDVAGLPEARTSPGIIGIVNVGPNTYEVDVEHLNGTICYSYHTTRSTTYVASAGPCPA